jgi:hypothetical protein
MHRVMDALKVQPSPSPVFSKSFALLGNIFDGSVPGSSNSIVNVTDTSGWNWHSLDPGIVQRTLSVVDGEYTITTVGIGTGFGGEWNEDLAGPTWSATGWMMRDPNQKVMDDYLGRLSSIESRAAQVKMFDAY